jgi:hypothetical protein
MRRRVIANILFVLVTFAIMAAGLAGPFEPTRVIAVLFGVTVVHVMTLLLTSKPRGVAIVERERDRQAADFLKKLQKGQAAITDQKRA